MDRQTVLARTNKGHKEVAGRTTFLKHADRSVLFLMTGKETLAEIERRIDPSIAKRLDSVVQKLLREEFVYRPEPHEISMPPERINAGRMVATDSMNARAIVTMEPPEVSVDPATDATDDPVRGPLSDPAADDMVNAVLRQAKESSRRQGIVERMRQLEADARKKAAAPASSSARGMVLPAKRLQAAYSLQSAAQDETTAAEPALDPKRILSRSGKGALEFIGRTCTLRPGLQKILAQVDGVSTVGEILRRIGHSEKAVASGLETLLKRGYIQDSAVELGGLEPEVDFDVRVYKPEQPSQSPAERLAPADLEMMEGVRATLADVWRELAAQQRRELAAQAEEAARAAAAAAATPVDRDDEANAIGRGAAKPVTDGDWASEQFARHAARRKDARAAQGARRRLLTALGGLIAACAVVAYLLAPLIDSARYEAAAGQYFDERVRIGGTSVAFLPQPALKFTDVRIGEEAGGIRIDNVYARLGLEWLAGSEVSLPAVTIDGATVTTAELRRLLRPGATANPRALTLRRIEGRNVQIVDSSWKLHNATIDVEVGRNHAVRRLAVGSADGAFKAQLLPAADGVINLEISAAKMQLPGAGLVVDQFDARGTYGDEEIVLREFDGRLLGGVISGHARIRQGALWAAEGTLEARGLSLVQIARPLFEDGTLSAKGRFKTTASAPHALFAAGNVEGTLGIDRGTFSGADLARAMLREDAPRGSTLFTELSGAFSAQLGSRLSISGVRFKSHRISGTAAAQVEANGSLRAQIAGSLWTPQGPVNSGVDLSGTVRRPIVARRD